MLKSHNSVAHDLMHVQLLIQKLKVLLKSLFMNISRNVATIRFTWFLTRGLKVALQTLKQTTDYLFFRTGILRRAC